MRATRGARFARAELVIACLALALVAYAVVMRSHEIQGLRDQGVYTATGIELARTGDFGWSDALIRRFGFEPVSHLFEDIGDLLQGRPRYLRFAGFYLMSPHTARVTPQFLHGYEVWVGLAYLAGGPQATQCVNGVFAALALFAFGCTLRRLWGGQIALMAALLLATAPVQLWYARFPSNEPLVQMLLWTSVLTYTLLRGAPSSARQGAQGPVSGRTLLVFCLPVAAATVTKFAFWPMLVIFAFELGLAVSQGALVCKVRYALAGLVAVAVLAWVHAALFANFYLYGAWYHSLRKTGISFEMFPALFIGGVAGAFSAGAISGDLLRNPPRLPRVWRLALAAAFLLLLFAGWAWQWNLAASHKVGDVWSEQTNLHEFAQYYGPLVFVAAVLGYALWLARGDVRSAKRLIALLTVAAAAFLVHRNLDAVHPWASRRWLTVLVPMTALAAALGAAAASRIVGPRASGPLAAGLAVALGGLQLYHAPALVLTRNYRGAIPQVDQWATVLTSRDFVLLAPTAIVAQYGPYLAARFDVQGYVQPDTAEAWSRTRALAADPRFDFPRAMYVTDEELKITTPSLASLVATKQLDFPVLMEESHKLPAAPLRVSKLIRFYQLDLTSWPDGWWPHWKPPILPRAAQSPPLALDMGPDAQPYLLQGFFDPTPQGDGTFFRWTNGTGRIAIGKLLAFPLPTRPLHFVARMHSGRAHAIDVHWYLDLDKPGRERKLGTTPAGPQWTECRVEVDPALIRPDSVIEIQSLRPAVPPSHGAGQLGVRILDLRIE
jgi:hypothetical protein